jgi:hypothetical protein
LRKKKITSETLENIRNLLMTKMEAQRGVVLKENEFVIANWLWLDD